ncbi:MAG: hypothetical protein RBS38_01425 [Bacteroidales bacterium]|jgi:alpha-glucuronidase|nr:hypothetical protein [Bacteroidales bacterium]
MKYLIIISAIADCLRPYNIYNIKVYLTAIAGVANTGNTVYRAGNPLLKANHYTSGRLVRIFNQVIE